jgi:demethoxyubiquinone hydroxylase (CLK1/Coq7/Cat5 family)
MSTELSINTLNSFLRGEIAAVETYRQALKQMAGSDKSDELRDCLRSHEKRVATLRQQILNLGGHPAESSGAWGTFSRLFEGAAAFAMGDNAAIAVLEEGEDHGLKLYLEDVAKLDRESRKVVEREILPEQMRTHDSLSDLKLTLDRQEQ